jgi:hypothetical protein
MINATCPTCSKHSKSRFHQIDQKTFEMFGRDCQCMKCIDHDHIRFMQTTGKRLKMSCVKGCSCGFGK